MQNFIFIVNNICAFYSEIIPLFKKYFLGVSFVLGTVLDIGDTSVNRTKVTQWAPEGNSSYWEEPGSKWNEQATELRNSGEIGVGEHILMYGSR